jgi:hypothetical protein
MKVMKVLFLAFTLLPIFSLKSVAVETAEGVSETGSSAPVTIEIPAPEVIPGVSHPPLEGVVLHLGEKVRLDRLYQANEQPPEGCIEKPELAARFCLDPVQWPEGLGDPLTIDDVVYKGAQAIIRYDQGKSSQAHILFPSVQFVDMVEHLKNRFGTPTEEEFVKIPIPNSDSVVNTVVRWRSVLQGEDKDMILEVRAHDDIRRPFPDAIHGFIWLYRKGATPIFRHLSVVDLMVLRKRRIGQWPYTKAQR